nr:ATP synthase F0 subunit B [Pseudodesulfovibrio piezophilus]
MYVFSTVLLTALAISSIAFANEGGGHHMAGWFLEDYQVERYIFRLINLALFLGIIWWLAGSKIKDFFVGRRDGIKLELDDLQTRQADAEKKLKEVEAGIANMAQEKQTILDEAKQQGEAIKEAIIAKAHKDAEALKEQAKRTASNEAQTAINSIRAEMADMVVAAAEKIVAEKLSADDHEKLVDDYLTKVVLN